jgi:nitrate reductase (cytochrome), electron transfer subunit
MSGQAAAPRRVVGIGSVIALMVAGILTFGPAIEERGEPSDHPPAGNLATGDAIAAEAGVFRTSAADHAAPHDAVRRNTAHRRTLEMFRKLRAYPGAPPRIPHGLTAEEFRTPSCNACHERGGYVARFASYAPVTPHPELVNCLQCHAQDDSTVGVGLPGANPDDICLQCHVPGASAQPFRPSDWRTAAWPATGQQAMSGSPPVIPHDPHLRGNCLACHVGLGAVEEIQTTHPERANCRQCHVNAAPADAAFSRPVNRPARNTGGSP